MKNKDITSNIFWRLLERFGAHGVTLIVSIILARVLDPVLYGTIALVTVITSILQVFIDSGLGTALIQKIDADDEDFSTVFYFNFLVCLVLYLLLFLAAPMISKFYDRQELTPIVRVLGLLLIISGFKNIQGAYVARNLLFKKYFFATLGGTIVAAIVGIFMAYNGYGIWALVLQNLVNQFIDTVILWITVKWRPKLKFSFQKLKNLFTYGWKLLVSSLLDTVWRELSQLIVGKKYSSADLAYYNKGEEYPKFATTAINSSIDSVLLPVMSASQENAREVKNIARKSIMMSSFIMWPIMIGLASCANNFVSVILTDKWLFAVPYLQIFCFVYPFYPIHTANLNAIKAMGRSDLFLILEIIKKVVSLIVILTTMWFGVIWLALGSIITGILGQIINSWPNKKLLNYNYLEQIKDILPSIILSLTMGIIVYFVGLINLNKILLLFIQVCLGIVIYCAGAWIFKLEAFTICMNFIKQFVKKSEKNKKNDTKEFKSNEN